MIEHLLFRLLQLLPPETAHNVTFFLLSILEWIDHQLWRAEQLRLRLEARNRMIRLRREFPLTY